LANRVSNALSAFSLEHNKLIAIAFYKAGQSAGAAVVRQQQGRRRSGPGHTAPRLQ
jgi:hypothetical protein